jgi:hypothetical protein
LTGSRRNPAEMGTPMGTPGGRHPGARCTQSGLLHRQKHSGHAGEMPAGTGSAGYGRGERITRDETDVMFGHY